MNGFSNNNFGNNYATYNSNENDVKCNNERVWYNHYKGCIVKNYLDPKTNRIHQEKIAYNQPDNFLVYLNKYFMNDLN